MNSDYNVNILEISGHFCKRIDLKQNRKIFIQGKKKEKRLKSIEMVMIDIVTHTVNETKDFISTVRSVSCRFLRAQSTWWLECKSCKQQSCLPYPSHSVVYNADIIRPAAAECTCLEWEWAWLAKNCALVKCSLKVRAGLSY